MSKSGEGEMNERAINGQETILQLGKISERIKIDGSHD